MPLSIHPSWLPWGRRVESAAVWRNSAAAHQRAEHRAAIWRILDPETAITHRAARPSWNCDTCGAQWPCEPARARLLAEHEGDYTGLSMLLWTYLEDFSRESKAGPFGEAFARFIGWSRPTRSAHLG